MSTLKDCTAIPIKPKESGDVYRQLARFCLLLRAGKVKPAKDAFKLLHPAVQCFYLYYGWQILSKKVQGKKDSYLQAYRLFKLLRAKDMKDLKSYEYYKSLKSLNEKYSVASKEFSSRSKEKIKYEKVGQTKESIPKNSPLYIYYTTLYNQNPNSKCALRFLVEHGVYEGAEHAKLHKKYISVFKK